MSSGSTARTVGVDITGDATGVVAATEETAEGFEAAATAAEESNAKAAASAGQLAAAQTAAAEEGAEAVSASYDEQAAAANAAALKAIAAAGKVADAQAAAAERAAASADAEAQAAAAAVASGADAQDASYTRAAEAAEAAATRAQTAWEKAAAASAAANARAAALVGSEDEAAAAAGAEAAEAGAARAKAAWDAAALSATEANEAMVADTTIGDTFAGMTAGAAGLFAKVAELTASIPILGSVFKALAADIAGADTAGEGLIATAGAVGAIAAAVAGVVAGVSIKMASDFQKSIVLLETGAGESAKNLGMVASGIESMAASVGTSTDSLAQGMYHIESAGQHGAAALDELQAAAEGAKVGNADLDTVAKALVGTMNSFNIPASQATETMSQLVEIVASGDLKMDDLASSLGNVAPIAAKAGLSLAQIGGAIATMTSQNMTAAQATQDLAHTINSLLNPTTVQTQEMAQMGLQSQEVARNLGKEGLTGTLDELVTAITSHMGASGQVLMSAFNQSKSAAADLNTMLASMPASVKKLADEFMSGSMTVSQFRQALPTNLQGIVGQFTSLYNQVHGFNNLLKSGQPEAQTFNAALSKMVGGSTGLNTSLMLTGSSFGTFTKNVADVAAAATRGSSSVQGWATTTQTLAFQFDQLKAGAGALADRIGGALIPVASELARITMDVADWFVRTRAVSEPLVALIGVALAGSVAVFTGRLVAMTADAVIDGIGGLVAGFQTLVPVLGEVDAAADANPIGAIILAVAALGIGIAELVEHWSTVWGEIKQIAADAWQWLKDGFDAVWGFLDGIWQDIDTDIRSAWGDIVSFFEGLPGRLVAAIEDLPGLLLQVVEDAGELLLQGFEWGVAMLIASAIELPASLVEAMIRFGPDLVQWLKDAWDDLSGAVAVAFTTLVGFYESLPGRLLDALEDFGSDLLSWGQDAWHAFQDWDVSFVGGTVIPWFESLPGKIISALEDFPGDLLSWGQDAWHAFQDWDVSFVGGTVIPWFESLPGKIISAFGDAATMLYDVGKDIIEGLAKGIEDALGDVLDAVGNVASGIVNKVESTLGINSPSKVMAERVGVPIVEGITVGMSSQLASATSAATKLGSQIAAAARAGMSDLTAASPAATASVAAAARASVTVQQGDLHLTLQGVDLSKTSSIQATIEKAVDQSNRRFYQALGLVGVK